MSFIHTSILILITSTFSLAASATNLPPTGGAGSHKGKPPGADQESGRGTWPEKRQRMIKVLQQIEFEHETKLKEIIGSLQKANSEQDLDVMLAPWALLQVSINPESRVKINSLQPKIELHQNQPQRFLIRVENLAGITAPLNLTPVDLAKDPPAKAAWCTVTVVHNQVTSRFFTGANIEYKLMQITSRAQGVREIRITGDAGQGTQDLGFRATTDLLMEVKPQSQKNDN